MKCYIRFGAKKGFLWFVFATLATAVLAATSYINNSMQKETGFEDGTIAPYTICTTQNPNYGVPYILQGTKCMKFYWTQVGYDSTRMDKGAEACSNLEFHKDGWYGFSFYLPSPGFPLNKTQAIAQIFANGGCSSWVAMLEIRNNDLWIVHRGNCVATPQYQALVATNIQRNAWNPIVMHFRASRQNAGLLDIWYGQDVNISTSPTYSKQDINFAFGTWNGDILASTAGNSISLKFGMYNFDDGNYTLNENRTIYYDNVSQLVGNPSNAFASVNPTDETVLGLNVGERNTEWIRIYPNPAFSEITITSPFKVGEQAQLKLYDQKGRLVLSEAMLNQEKKLALDALQPGPYLLTIQSGSQIARQSFIKQ